MNAFAPNGLEILGTLEKLEARSDIQFDSFGCDENGDLTYRHSGHTECFWDDQLTVERDGETVFLDEEGNEWKKSELILKENET